MKPILILLTLLLLAGALQAQSIVASFVDNKRFYAPRPPLYRYPLPMENGAIVQLLTFTSLQAAIDAPDLATFQANIQWDMAAQGTVGQAQTVAPINPTTSLVTNGAVGAGDSFGALLGGVSDLTGTVGGTPFYMVVFPTGDISDQPFVPTIFSSLGWIVPGGVLATVAMRDTDDITVLRQGRAMLKKIPSGPQLNVISNNPGTLIELIAWNLDITKIYQWQWSANLSDWSTPVPLSLTLDLAEFSHANGPANPGFYRVLQLAPP